MIYRQGLFSNREGLSMSPYIMVLSTKKSSQPKALSVNEANFEEDTPTQKSEIYMPVGTTTDAL